MSSKKDLVSGSVIFGFGAIFAWLASRFSIWESYNEPGPGFFPLGIAMLIIGLSLIVILKALFVTLSSKDGPERLMTATKSIHFVPIVSYGGAILLFGVLLEKVGFILAAMLLLIITLKVEKKSWKVTLLFTALAITISVLLFKILLGVPFPQGSLAGL